MHLSSWLNGKRKAKQIATKLLLTGKINVLGVHTPVIKELYDPILAELETYGIKFAEEEIEF